MPTKSAKPKKANTAALSDAAVKKATGKTWSQWKAVLSKAKGEPSHKELVAMVKKAGVKDASWQKTVASTFEKMRGAKTADQTEDAGFQIDVQKTFLAASDKVWEHIVSPAGRTIWLGSMTEFHAEQGKTYETVKGVTGEIQSAEEGKMMCLTWQQKGKKESMVQLRLIPNHGKTSVSFHHENLKNKKEREEMRRMWQSALDRLSAFFIVEKEED